MTIGPVSASKELAAALVRARLPEAVMQAYGSAALVQALAHAWRVSPYYRRSWTAAGLAASFRQQAQGRPLAVEQVMTRIPALDKTTLVANWDEVADPALLGPASTSERTSGSSGLVLDVRTDPPCAAAKAAGWYRAHLAYGFLPHRTMAFFRFSAGEPGLVERLGLWRATWVDAEQDVEARFERLRTLAPDIVGGYPSHLVDIATRLDRKDLRSLGLRAVVSGSETLTPTARELVGDAFGAPVFDVYGCFEFGNVAFECRRGRRHVSADAVHVEVLDDAGRPAPPGVVGDLVLTGLRNRALPLVRYRIGDRGALGPPGCPCGRTLPLLTELAGRADDFLVGRGFRLSQAGAGEVLKRVPGVRQFELRQETDLTVHARLVLVAGVDDVEARRTADRAATTLGDHLGGVPVVATCVAALRPGPGGKVRPVFTTAPWP